MGIRAEVRHPRVDMVSSQASSHNLARHSLLLDTRLCRWWFSAHGLLVCQQTTAQRLFGEPRLFPGVGPESWTPAPRKLPFWGSHLGGWTHLLLLHTICGRGRQTFKTLDIKCLRFSRPRDKNAGYCAGIYIYNKKKKVKVKYSNNCNFLVLQV